MAGDRLANGAGLALHVLYESFAAYTIFKVANMYILP